MLRNMVARERSEALCKATFATRVIVATVTVLTIYSKGFLVSIVHLETVVKCVGNRSHLKYLPFKLITPCHVTIICPFKCSLLEHPAFVLWKLMCNIDSFFLREKLTGFQRLEEKKL